MAVMTDELERTKDEKRVVMRGILRGENSVVQWAVVMADLMVSSLAAETAALMAGGMADQLDSSAVALMVVKKAEMKVWTKVL